MTDSKLAGTGNSRFLKSVSNFKALYPTYDDFVAALVAGTLPIDLNGTNPEGWTQQGTPLSKATLLTDEAATHMGLSGDATVAQAILKALPSAQRGANNGVASLNNSGKIPTTQIPSLSYIPTSQKGAANGVATLGSNGKIPSTQMPTDIKATGGVLVASDFSTETDGATVTDSTELYWLKVGNIVTLTGTLYVQFDNSVSASEVTVSTEGLLLPGSATPGGFRVYAYKGGYVDIRFPTLSSKSVASFTIQRAQSYSYNSISASYIAYDARDALS